MVWWMAAGRLLILEDADKGRGIPIQVWVAIVIGLCLILFMKKTHRRRTQATIRAAAASASSGGSDETRGPGTLKGQHDPEVARLYVELNEFAREMEGRMDTKIAYLRRLIADAEKVMAGLSQAIADGDAMQKGQPRPTVADLPPPDHVPELPASPSPSPSSPPAPPRVDITIGDGPDAGQKSPAHDDLKMRILRLAGEGKPKEAIAEAVGIPKGEVELVLGLHRASQKQKKKQEPKDTAADKREAKNPSSAG